MPRAADLRGRLLGAAAGALFATAAAAGLEPDVLPEPLLWRDAPATSFARDPRPPVAIAGAGLLRFESEWAPLYSGPDGGRLERARHALRATSASGPWRAGFEVESQFGIATGSGAGALVGAETPAQRTPTLALARDGRRFGFGAGVSWADDRAGGALAGSARLAPGLSATVTGSRLPERGRAEVGWEDVRVDAAGAWEARRMSWRVEGDAPRGMVFWLGQESLDRKMVARTAAPGDQLEPELAWLANTAGVRARAAGADWRLEAQAGSGRQRTALLRSGTQYALVAGPVSQSLVTLDARPLRAPLRVRAWEGRWSGDARASLALWPFDGLGAVFGTRRLAHSTASLEHLGLSLDARPGWRGLDGGLAIARLRPRADYESWQATMLGLGYDDPSSGATTLRSAWLAGARLAFAHAWRGVRVRAEAVQWAPVRLNRSASGGGSAGGGAGPETQDSGSGAGTRGGTLVRFSVETGP